MVRVGSPSALGHTGVPPRPGGTPAGRRTGLGPETTLRSVPLRTERKEGSRNVSGRTGPGPEGPDIVPHCAYGRVRTCTSPGLFRGTVTVVYQ